MENATKALLIAAAVLIAIVLVALGVSLLSSTGGTTEDAGEVAEQIGTSTSSAVSSVGTALGKLEGNNMITFYIQEVPNIYTYKWPAGMNAKEAIEKGYTDGKIVDKKDFVVFINKDGQEVLISYDQGTNNFLSSEEWKPYNNQEIVITIRK